MSGLWRAFWRGFGNTLGIAPVRRYVPTPAEQLEAASADVRAAIAAAAERYRNGNPDSAEFDVDDSVIGFGQREKCGGPCCGGDGPVRPPRRT